MMLIDVVLFILLQRLYDIHTSTTMSEVNKLFASHTVSYSSSWDEGMRDLLRKVTPWHVEPKCGSMYCSDYLDFLFFESTIYTNFQLLATNPDDRLSSLEDLKEHPYLASVDFDKVMKREIKPTFIPPVRSLMQG